MEDNRNEVENELSDQAKVISLFQFIQELNKLKQKAILNIKDYPWSFSLSDLPDDHENISLHYRDRVSDDWDSEKAEDGNLILSVHKPEFQKCPEPELSFELWLEPGWNYFRQEASVRALTQQQYRWRMEGLSIDHPKAHKPVKGLEIV